MKIALVDSNYTVLKLYESPSIENLRLYTTAHSILGQLLDVGDNVVEVGYVYDTDTNSYRKPENTNTTSAPRPSAPTLDQVMAELENIRREVVTTYGKQWGTISQELLWPLIKEETREVLPLAEELIVAENYPAIYSYLETHGTPTEEITSQLIKLTAQKFNKHIKNHVTVLASTEKAYKECVALYKSIEDPIELVAWDSDTAWETFYGA